jgi:stage II sporulation protein D
MGEHRRRRRLTTSAAAGIATIALVAGASVIMVAGSPPRASAAEVVVRPASGTWIVDGHGFGHGRGMSQWGARAAAAAGLSGERILGFYYPGTGRAPIGNPILRVQVNDSADPFVQLLPVAGLRLGWTGHGVVLPALAGLQRWQVGRWGSAYRMRYKTAAGWHWYGGALPRSVTVTASHGVLRVYRNNGTATDYRQSLVVTRSGFASVLVNRLRMEFYLRGVVPRESPASWPVQALRAQATAARTYAERARRAPRSSLYDICDTTACQVYGGAANWRASGSRLSGEETRTNAAVASTAGVILTAGGKPAVTEYSASNGGQVAAGGRSYLPARRDPYTAGDPYGSWSVKVKVADVAAKLGLRRVDKVTITARDRAGAFGGRVLAATVAGVDRAGKPRSVAVTGSALKNALGLRSNYFRLRAG